MHALRDPNRQDDTADLLGQLRDSLQPPRSEFKLTEDGIWHPTPLDVVVGVLAELDRLDRDEETLRVMDAGAGDGRWLVALGLWARTTGRSLAVRGAETDADLFAAAAAALRRAGLEEDVDLTRSDYLDDRELLVEDDVVLHYPDGNEHELARRLLGSDTELWVVTAQLALAVGPLELCLKRRVRRPENIDWHLHVYADPAR